MLDCANNIIKAYQMKAVGGKFKGITIDENSTLKGFIQTDNIATKIIAGVYFIDQDTGNSASPINNIVMGKVGYSNNVKRVIKCGTGKYVIVLTDLDINYGDYISETAFSCRIIRASDSLHVVSGTILGQAGKYRYGKNNNKCFIQTTLPIRSLSTGNFEIDDYSHVCVTWDSDNLPVSEYSHWFNGGYYETWRENGVTYWGIGITVTDNNNDSYVSLFGGCQLLLEASRLITT